MYLLISLYANPLLTATEGNLTSLGLKARHVSLNALYDPIEHTLTTEERLFLVSVPV